MDTEGVDSLPMSEPHVPHICMSLAEVPPEFAPLTCEGYPFAWEEGCDKNEKLQTCDEFLEGLIQACGKKISTCEYEACSLALQQITCGEWPEECNSIAHCESPFDQENPTTG